MLSHMFPILGMYAWQTQLFSQDTGDEFWTLLIRHKIAFLPTLKSARRGIDPFSSSLAMPLHNKCANSTTNISSSSFSSLSETKRKAYNRKYKTMVSSRKKHSITRAMGNVWCNLPCGAITNHKYSGSVDIPEMGHSGKILPSQRKLTIPPPPLQTFQRSSTSLPSQLNTKIRRVFVFWVMTNK